MQCPKCGGPMWDNRFTKRKPSQPDYKCKNKQGCDGAVWLDNAGPQNQQSNPPTQNRGGYQQQDRGSLPNDPLADQPNTTPVPPQKNKEEAQREFLAQHKKAFAYVLKHYVPDVRALNAELANDGEVILLDLRGISALTYQILRGLGDIQ